MSRESPPPRGLRDLSGARLTRHALERFAERFASRGGGDAPDPTEAEAEAALRLALTRTRRLGRNPANGAVALMALFGARPLVAIFQGETCLTVLTWPQFEPRLVEFGRPRAPRKWGRWLRRLNRPDADPAGSDLDPTDIDLGPVRFSEEG